MMTAIMAVSVLNSKMARVFGFESLMASRNSCFGRSTAKLIAKLEREEGQEVIKGSSQWHETMMAIVENRACRKTRKRFFKKKISGVDRMEEEIKKLANIEMCILQMLISNRGVNYAYGLVDQSEGLLNRNGIYTTLARMELKGLIESEIEEVRPGAKGKPRRIYKTTGLGQRSLADAQARMAAFNANWSTA